MHTTTISDHYQKKSRRRVAYFFFFVSHIIWLAWFIIYSRRKETKRAYVLLADIEKKFDGHFNKATLRKIAISYGIYNPMICDAFCRLRGRYTSEEEKNRFIHYFICSSLFDDFTDDHLITQQQLEHISFRPQTYPAVSFDEKIFQYAHLLLIDYVKNQEEYLRVSQILFQAQIDSQQQYNSSLTKDEIQSITFHKGGNAVLLCSYYLDDEVSNMEKKCWYQAGCIIQLTNDLFDIYKDINDHITTLATQITDAGAFEKFFINEIRLMKNSIDDLPFSFRRKRLFNLQMAGIYSFGLIAIQQLKTIQRQEVKLPDLSTLLRKQLIIDMEKISNIILWFRFTYQYGKY